MAAWVLWSSHASASRVDGCMGIKVISRVSITCRWLHGYYGHLTRQHHVPMAARVLRSSHASASRVDGCMCIIVISCVSITYRWLHVYHCHLTRQHHVSMAACVSLSSHASASRVDNYVFYCRLIYCLSNSLHIIFTFQLFTSPHLPVASICRLGCPVTRVVAQWLVW